MPNIFGIIVTSPFFKLKRNFRPTELCNLAQLFLDSDWLMINWHITWYAVKHSSFNWFLVSLSTYFNFQIAGHGGLPLHQGKIHFLSLFISPVEVFTDDVFGNLADLVLSSTSGWEGF